MEIKDVEKLAELSRIELRDDEKNELLKDMQSILGYIDQIEKVGEVLIEDQAMELRNVMRDDLESHQSGIFTKSILAEVPESKDDFVKVQKIL